MSEYPKFGERLNQLLIAQDRSPAWLAKRLRVNGATVSRWLNEGARPGSPEAVVRIADVLGVTQQRAALLAAAGYGYIEGGSVEIGKQEEQAAAGTPRVEPLGPRAGVPTLGRSTLPQPLTPLIGRGETVAELVDRLSEPACRLLTLVGPGGIGKTRLAIEVAHALKSTHAAPASADANSEGVRLPDGRYFVALAEVQDPQQISAAIAAALGLLPTGTQPVHEQLLDALGDKRLLLVLDNFEHLQSGAAVVTEILAHAPRVKVLVTSRIALGVAGEWYHPVHGLRVPGEMELGGDELRAYGSVRLFEHCARQALPTFDLDADAYHVQRICRAVEGMPLAIELAAAWLRVLPCARIVQQITHNMAALVSPLAHAQPRHASMQAVLTQSWQQLTPHEAAVLEVLAHFQGGFDEEAAAAVAQADLMTLAALAQKSMIQVKQEVDRSLTGRVRYNLHEILRQFAKERAQARPDIEEAMARHSQHYLQRLQQLTPQLLGQRPHVAQAMIAVDMDNIRAAWNFATRQQHFAALAATLEAVYLYSLISGRLAEGIHLIELAATALQDEIAKGSGGEGDAGYQRVYGDFLARLGALYTELPDADRAIPVLQASLAQAGTPEARAFVLLHLGYAFSFRHNLSQAEQLLQESLTFSREVHDLVSEADALYRLSALEGMRGNYQQSYELAKASLDIFRTLGRGDKIVGVLASLGVTENFMRREDNFRPGAH